MKTVLLQLIRCYRYALAPFFGRNCRFAPSCSEYAMEAIEKYGAGKGGALGVRRLLRCHPWHSGGYDPVP